MSTAEPIRFLPPEAPEDRARADLYALIARFFYAPPDGHLTGQHEARQAALGGRRGHADGQLAAQRLPVEAALTGEHENARRLVALEFAVALEQQTELQPTEIRTDHL